MLVPILVGVAMLLILDEHGNRAIGAGLLTLCAPMLWLASITLTSVEFNDEVIVHYLMRTRHYSYEDVAYISHVTEKSSQFTPENALRSTGSYSVRRYELCEMQLENGKQVRFQVTMHQLRVLALRFGQDRCRFYYPEYKT